MFATLLKTTEGVFLFANEDFSVAASESEAEALRVWEDVYIPAHTRSHERSMSACMHMIMFQPSIIEFDGIEDLTTFIYGVDGKAQPVTLESVAGSLNGLRCTEAAEARWAEGTSPRFGVNL